MRRQILFLFLLIPSICSAGIVTVESNGSGSLSIESNGSGSMSKDYSPDVYLPDYFDILFYWNCDSVTTGISPQKGVGTITIGASWSLNTGVVGNSADINNTGNSGGRISISTATALPNIDVSQGRIGFYFHPFETGSASDGDPFYGAGATTSPFMYFQNSVGNYVWKYKDEEVNVGGVFSADTTYFVELAWDSDEAELGVPCRIIIDGSTAGSCPTGSTGADPAPTSLRFGGLDGNATDAWYDQIIISNDPTRNLYLLRDGTSF